MVVIMDPWDSGIWILVLFGLFNLKGHTWLHYSLFCLPKVAMSDEYDPSHNIIVYQNPIMRFCWLHPVFLIFFYYILHRLFHFKLFAIFKILYYLFITLNAHFSLSTPWRGTGMIRLLPYFPDPVLCEMLGCWHILSLLICD